MSEETTLTSRDTSASAGADPLQVVWHRGQVDKNERARLLAQRPSTMWLTGLSGAGKSTLAFALERRLTSLGYSCFVLDGDNVRHGLNRDLGFSPADRAENIRRIAEVARMMNQAGLIVISALISPTRDDRDMARQIIGPDAFHEIYVNTALQVCERRDPKGLYRRARAGHIPGFTGITAPYEVPLQPALALDTGSMGIEACVDMLESLVLSGISSNGDVSMDNPART